MDNIFTFKQVVGDQCNTEEKIIARQIFAKKLNKKYMHYNELNPSDIPQELKELKESAFFQNNVYIVPFDIQTAAFRYFINGKKYIYFDYTGHAYSANDYSYTINFNQQNDIIPLEFLCYEMLYTVVFCDNIENLKLQLLNHNNCQELIDSNNDIIRNNTDNMANIIKLKQVEFSGICTHNYFKKMYHSSSLLKLYELYIKNMEKQLVFLTDKQANDIIRNNLNNTNDKKFGNMHHKIKCSIL